MSALNEILIEFVVCWSTVDQSRGRILHEREREIFEAVRGFAVSVAKTLQLVDQVLTHASLLRLSSDLCT